MKEEHVTLPGPIILGVVLIVAGLVLMFMLDSNISGGLLILLGVASAIAGIRGKTVRSTLTVPVAEKVSAPQPVAQPKPTFVRKEVKPPFTRGELQKVLDVLAQVDKIVRAI